MSVWCGKINMICYLAIQNRGREEDNIKIENSVVFFLFTLSTRRKIQLVR